MHIFVCNSPLQILNSIEARNKFGACSKDSILVLVPLANNIRSLEGASSLVEWAKVITLPIRPVKRQSGLGELWRRLKYRHRYVNNWQSKLGSYRRQASAVYFSRTAVEPVEQIVNWLEPKLCVHIDDGTLSAELVYKKQKEAKRLSMCQGSCGSVEEGADRRKGLRARIWQLQDRLLGVSALPREPDVFFSAYVHDASWGFVLNESEWLATQVDEAGVARGEVHFLGAPFVERDLVDRERYCRALEIVMREFESSRIVYILHPAESDEMGEYISRRFGIEVRRFSLPYEVEFVRAGSKPETVASWFCTALESLSKGSQLRNIDFVAFDIGPLGDGNNGVAKAGRDFFERNEKNPNIRIYRIPGSSER